MDRQQQVNGILINLKKELELEKEKIKQFLIFIKEDIENKNFEEMDFCTIKQKFVDYERLEFIESVFLKEEFFNQKNWKGKYIITNDTIEAIYKREAFSSLYDFMYSTQLYSNFVNPYAMEENFIPLFERMILKG